MARSTLRDQLKPIELVLLSAVLALFVGLVVLLVTREPLLAVIFFGVAFIVVVVVIAMFALTMKPNSDELRELAGEDLSADADQTGSTGGAPAAASAEDPDATDESAGDSQSPR